MRLSSIESVTWCDRVEGQPLRLVQRGNSTSAILFLAFLLPALVATVLPVVAVGVLLVSNSTAQAAIADRVGSLLLIALGFGVMATILGLPAWRFFGQIGVRRTVEISNGQLSVFDRSAFGQHSWASPLSAFDGLVLQVRTTLSGQRHELVLMHGDRSKCILVHVAAAISENDIDQIRSILGQTVVSRRVLPLDSATSACDHPHSLAGTQVAA